MADADDQQAIVAFLSRADSYGIDGPVERIDTHAAMIFLADDRAYKLKRAVRYAYLDFSTPEKRRKVCEAELALNRRTAPELYLELRSIDRRSDGSLGFGGGEPLDWVVVMRRFPAEGLLEAVASRGELSPALIRELADGIARFHDEAEVQAGRAGADRLRDVLEGNRAAMAALPADALPSGDCTRWHDRSLELLAKLAPLLDRRAAEGHVRHCHGDLHLGNICQWQGRPLLFDCLEFDEALATTDVLYDLAFLLMDLWEKGHRTEASLLFNRYLDRRDELEGIAAMPLFLSLRAAVRAHVDATAAARQPSAEGRAARLAEGRAYLAAALAFLDRQAPRLIAIGGLSGTGKSTLAAALAPDVGSPPGARWLRSDVLRKRLAGVSPETRLPPDAYAPRRSAAVYHRLMDDARTALEAGQSVIVDAVLSKPRERDEVCAVARQAKVPFTGIWLDAPRETLIARVAARSGDASDAGPAVVERQLGYDLGSLAGWHRIAASGGPAEVLARARALLGTGD